MISDIENKCVGFGIKECSILQIKTDLSVIKIIPRHWFVFGAVDGIRHQCQICILPLAQQTSADRLYLSSSETWKQKISPYLQLKAFKSMCPFKTVAFTSMTSLRHTTVAFRMRDVHLRKLLTGSQTQSFGRCKRLLCGRVPLDHIPIERTGLSQYDSSETPVVSVEGRWSWFDRNP